MSAYDRWLRDYLNFVGIWLLAFGASVLLALATSCPAKHTPAPPPAITPVSQPRCFPEGTELPSSGFAACIDPIHTQQRST